MPLDGHLYLVSQGWRGKGTGLRDGAITRPVVIPQKKNLAGLGKDRDEAFPFWDHLFTAASKSIQLKCSSDSDVESNAENSSCVIRRTTTGILSNRRPVEGTSVASNSSTPSADLDSSKPRLNLLAAAKRDAAKQSLYSRFFRGSVLEPDDEAHGLVSRNTILIEDVIEDVNINSKAVIDVVKEGRTPKRKRDLEGGGGEGVRQRKKKRKGLNAVQSKGDNGIKKHEVTTSLSVAEGLAKGIDSESERKRRKAEKKRKKKELQCMANK